MITRMLNVNNSISKTGIIEYQILRKNVKNITIKILPTADVVVTANESITTKELDDFVISKLDWIVKHQVKQEARLKVQNSLKYQDNDVLLYLGERYLLKILENTEEYNNTVCLTNDNNIVVYCNDVDDKNDIKNILNIWYMNEAKTLLQTYFDETVEKYKDKIPNIEGLRLDVKEFKSIWGKCVPKQYRIALNSKLIHADRTIIQYVIMHELCHIVYLDHGKKFKQMLGRLMPNYKALDKRLKEESYEYRH